METETRATAIAVAFIAATLLVSGPLVSAVSLGQAPGTGLDDGNATVNGVALASDLSVTEGRFGTGVAYLRVPDAAVELGSVAGTPRLVYRVSVPGLGIEGAETRRLSSAAGRVSVGFADRALRYETVRQRQYRAAVSVHVQSFAVYRTVYRRNVTVDVTVDEGVRPGG